MIEVYKWNGESVGGLMIVEWARQKGYWVFADLTGKDDYLEIGQRETASSLLNYIQICRWSGMKSEDSRWRQRKALMRNIQMCRSWRKTHEKN